MDFPQEEITILIIDEAEEENIVLPNCCDYDYYNVEIAIPLEEDIEPESL